VRSRHAFATSDYARTEHQRQFVGALAGKIMSPGVLLNPFRSIPAILDLPGALTVDHGAGLWDLITLARHVRHFSNVISTAVPIGGSNGSDLLWDPTKAPQLFHDLNHDQTIPLVSHHALTSERARAGPVRADGFGTFGNLFGIRLPRLSSTVASSQSPRLRESAGWWARAPRPRRLATGSCKDRGGGGVLLPGSSSARTASDARVADVPGEPRPSRCCRPCRSGFAAAGFRRAAARGETGVWSTPRSSSSAAATSPPSP
jgi:hypothetical protein